MSLAVCDCCFRQVSDGAQSNSPQRGISPSHPPLEPRLLHQQCRTLSVRGTLSFSLAQISDMQGANASIVRPKIRREGNDQVEHIRTSYVAYDVLT